MAFVPPHDRVLDTSTSNSQTVFAISGSGLDLSYNTFSAAMSIGDTTIGGVVEPGVAFASGILTYSALNQVTVSTVFESKGTFSAGGTKQVFMGLPASRAALGTVAPPQGRLTLTSGTPVMTTSVASAGTVYYTAYAGNRVPIYDGANFYQAILPGNEISQATTDTTKSPAAVVASGIYDLFVWNDAGTIRLSRGPAWSSSTARGAGAGTTELQLINGIDTNKYAITNGPAANLGTFVGTIGANGSALIDYIFPAVSVSGTQGVMLVWNAYNRVDVTGFCGITTGSWSYNVANTWRMANGSTTYGCYFLRGLEEDGVNAILSAQAAAGASTNAAVGIGLDSTSAVVGRPMYIQTSTATPLTAYYDGYPGIGLHRLTGLEFNNTTTASTFYGNPVSYIQTGLSVRFRA